MSDTIHTDPNPKQREELGQCEYKRCPAKAYYRIDFGSDDIDAILCSTHHARVLVSVESLHLPGLIDCEGDE